MASIDYTSVFDYTMTAAIGDNGKPSFGIELISFPFRDPEGDTEDWLWKGPEGFQRFLDMFSPSGVIGTNPDGSLLLADNISYLAQIMGPGLAALNMGTLCNPNWVGSLVSTGFDARKSYWVSFHDDLRDPFIGAQGFMDSTAFHSSHQDFYDYDNAIDGQQWDWLDNAISDWAFHNKNTGYASKEITLELINPVWNLENVKPSSIHWIAYPFDANSPTQTDSNEYSFAYPDEVWAQIVGSGLASQYQESGGSANTWIGSVQNLVPGMGYQLTAKDSDDITTDADILGPNEEVQLYMGSFAANGGIPWDSYSVDLGGVTYRASDYTLDEVRGKDYNELHNNPYAFAGFVNNAYHQGVWNPDNLPQTYATRMSPNSNVHTYIHNGILLPNFEPLWFEEGNIFNSFMFSVWYDPLREEHFIWGGYRLGTSEWKNEGFCSREEEDCGGTGENHEAGTDATFSKWKQSKSDMTSDYNPGITAGQYWFTWKGNHLGWNPTMGNGPVDNDKTYWTTNNHPQGPLFPEWQKQRDPFQGYQSTLPGWGGGLGVHPATGDPQPDVISPPQMPYTHVLYHHPTQKFYQLRPANVRYKVFNQDYDNYALENTKKVMHYYTDNHGEDEDGNYEGSDREGTWKNSTWGYSDSGYKELAVGMACPPPPANMSSSAFWHNLGGSSYYIGDTKYIEIPCQMVMQQTPTINFAKKMSDITEGPFERDVDKTVEGG